MIVKGLLSTEHVLLAHLIPIRRCNLSCAYCDEYDDHSKPVPLDVLRQRVDRLASFGTTVITISGGEPLLHPELDLLIRHIRSRGIIAGLITNGYLLTEERIAQLNRAGLEHLQISIDNVVPDDVSKKSLKVLDKKLELLAEHADFHVNINSVVGGGIHYPQDALTIAHATPPDLVISDYAMPDCNGLELLVEMRKRHPQTVRMIMTGKADLQTVIAAINDGHVYRFVLKPWDSFDLRVMIKLAMRHLDSLRAVERLAKPRQPRQ